MPAPAGRWRLLPAPSPPQAAPLRSSSSRAQAQRQKNRRARPPTLVRIRSAGRSTIHTEGFGSGHAAPSGWRNRPGPGRTATGQTSNGQPQEKKIFTGLRGSAFRDRKISRSHRGSPFGSAQGRLGETASGGASGSFFRMTTESRASGPIRLGRWTAEGGCPYMSSGRIEIPKTTAAGVAIGVLRLRSGRQADEKGMACPERGL
jgi:hypothetical protein